MSIKRIIKAGMVGSLFGFLISPTVWAFLVLTWHGINNWISIVGIIVYVIFQYYISVFDFINTKQLPTPYLYKTIFPTIFKIFGMLMVWGVVIYDVAKSL